MSMADDDTTGAIDTSDNSGAPPVMAPSTPPAAAPVNDDATGVDQAQVQQAQNPGQAPGSPPAGTNDVLNARNVPQNAKRILAYLLGTDAANPATIDQVGSEIDPQQQMTPADRNLLAIDHVRNSQGDNAAWGLMQANRVAYNAQQAFAKTALQGTPQKPADLNAAIQAANKAQANVLDGSNIQFSPAQGGVTATVTAPGAPPKTMNLSVQQFSQFLDVGGDGQWDKVMESGAPATLAKIAATQPASQPLQTGLATIGPGAPRKPPGPSIPVTPGAAADQASPGATAPAARTQTTYGHTPSTVNLSGSEAPNEMPSLTEAQKSNYGDELENRARRMFPGITQEAQRNAWMSQQEEQELKRQNEIDVASEKGRQATERARVTGTGRVQAAEATGRAKVEAAGIYSGAKLQAAQAAIQAKQQQLGQANQNSEEGRRVKIISSKLATGNALTPDEDAYLKQQFGNQQRQPAPAAAPRQQAAPQANPGQPPVQGAKFYKGQWYTRGPNGESVAVQ